LRDVVRENVIRLTQGRLEALLREPPHPPPTSLNPDSRTAVSYSATSVA
jgi:hypothetical protein